ARPDQGAAGSGDQQRGEDQPDLPGGRARPDVPQPRLGRQRRQDRQADSRRQMRIRTRWVLAVLLAAMIVSALVSIRYGALDVSGREMASASAALLSGHTAGTLDERIFAELR